MPGSRASFRVRPVFDGSAPIGTTVACADVMRTGSNTTLVPSGAAVDRAWACVHRLTDGTEVTIRMLVPEDRPSFLAGFEGLSRKSRYLRFFTAMPRLPASVLQRLLNTDGIDHAALAAWRSGYADVIVGVARFIRLRAGGDAAEVAVAVVDHMQRRGIARLLLAHLAEAARERGIRRFRAEVLCANDAVRALMHDVVKTTPVAMDGNIAVYDVEVPADGVEAFFRQPDA
jgi:GNAT superfamily N-acetyltransferase